MNSEEIRSKYLKYFENKGHTIVPSGLLVPENDPTTLFTGSGMQPMLPYLLGQTHPLGTRIVDSQKSFRTGDIEDVGDNRHTTFFEMLGNWSFGDYFQEEQLTWVFDFLINEIKLDPKKIFVTVFAGDEENGLPRDTKACELWQKLFALKGIEAKDVVLDTEENGAKLGMQGGKIFYYGAKNWWSRAGTPEKMPIGEPGGPDSEIFYEFDFIPHDPKYGENCHPNCDCGRYMEIGNSVFMQYVKVADKKFELLPKKNIDFGGGFERIAAAAINSSDVFEIDIFKGIIKTLERLSGKTYKDSQYTRSMRIVADHVRAATFLIGDGVNPSNIDRGYFVRRLLRRAIRVWDTLGIPNAGIGELVEPLLTFYKTAYPETWEKRAEIKSEIDKEENKFRQTLEKGMREFEKGTDPFILFTSYGFPIELTEEIAKEKGVTIDRNKFEEEFKKHQELSRAGAEKKFKGGLGDTSDKSLQYHTATHLLQQALRDVLGNEVGQKGSNITPERLRFDFTFSRKMTDEEKKRVEDIVNEKIKASLPVEVVTLPKEEAEKTGAIHFFGEKYPDMVTVYYIGNDLNSAYSKEFCGGPHVKNTEELKGRFKIQKEEAVSAGVRRIKAVLE